MKLSIVIPCYNECATIQQIVDAVKSSPVRDKEIVIVDDCSTDGTQEILRTVIISQVDKILFHEVNQGKGAALRTGFKHVTGDVVIVQDADMEYDPQEYPMLMEPIEKGRADVVFGSRFIGSDAHRVLYFWHSVANRMLTLASNMFTNLNLTDMETCYKCFKREVIQSIDLQEKRFGIEPELASKVAKGRWRIYEVGISYSGRTYDEGKKIGPKDAFRAIYCVIKYR